VSVTSEDFLRGVNAVGEALFGWNLKTT